MARFALLLEYDGSDFHGWQIQRGVATVQAELERALSSFAAHQVATITAGRTDTGVHARHQVVHFDSSAMRQPNGWISGVNAKLPLSIRVRQVQTVSDDFDARFSAYQRTYHYYLLLQPQNSALLNRHVGWYHKELNLSLMQDAAKLLLGKQDFSSFRAAGCQAKTPIREMHSLAVEQRGNIIRFSLSANAFLHHMVRNIVGALVYVGAQRISVTEFAAIIAQANRCYAPPTFMPNGLYLVDVKYPQAIFQSTSADSWLYTL